MSLQPYAVSGTVFDDSNENGVQDVTPQANPPRDELGIAGVTVTAYNSVGVVVGSATTDTAGHYTITVPLATGPVRVQFSGFGPGTVNPTHPNLQFYQPSIHHLSDNGVTEGTTVEFVDGSTSDVNLGLLQPSHYCEDNPDVATACFLFGGADPNDPNKANSPNTGNPILVSFPYTATATSGTDRTPDPTELATYGELGTVNSLVYRNFTDDLFAATYIKRHTGLGPGGDPGDIYLLHGARGGTPSTPRLFAVVPDAGSNPHATTDYLHDSSAYNAVGKVGLGEMALSEDQTTFYVVNLATQSLDTILLVPLSNPLTTSSVQSSVSMLGLADEVGSAHMDFRPFAMAEHDGAGSYAG